MAASDPIEPRQTLAALATRFAGAARVFQRRGLDFCCHGAVSLADAAAEHGIDLDQLLEELRRELIPMARSDRWDERPVPELVDHLLRHFHDSHRRELPRLIDLAERVEQTHRGAPDCPTGLAAHLRQMTAELDNHMRKEEEILFPMLCSGHGSHAAGPIQVMESEHLEHGQNLLVLRRLTNDLRNPDGACASWRALTLGLRELERALMQHIHLENHVLFPRVLTH